MEKYEQRKVETKEFHDRQAKALKEFERKRAEYAAARVSQQPSSS